MSHAVVRGNPTAAQLYLDVVLDEILTAKGKPHNVFERENINLAQILYHSLKKHPLGIFMINGDTGELVTRQKIFKDAISLARALIAKGAKGKTITLIMKNHQRMTAIYLAALFAETLPYMQDPCTTVFELTHYLKLVEPTFVFCDEDLEESFHNSLKEVPGLKTDIVVFEKEEHLKAFARGYSDDVEDFKIADKSPDSSVMMLPTSGSTGLPKAALMTERGLVAQLPGAWLYHTKFPQPTELAMVLTTLQWMTFTMTITSGVVYDIPLLITPKPTSVNVVKDMLIKFRPTWTFFGPAFMKTLLPEITSDHFSSLKTATLLGAPSSMELIAAVKEKLPEGALLCNGFGTTEAQGYIAHPDPDAPLRSNGRVINIFQYKMLDDNGKEVGLCQNGVLHIKGTSCIQGYYKNDEAYNESFVDGWYSTGDLFYIDENERLHYLERKKFNFKFRGCHVAPEEVECVISSVPGVQQCFVCGTESGPAAAVVVQPYCDVTRKQIHKAVDASLSDHKRLHGGVAFVSYLPHTHSGKIQRAESKKILEKLIQAGECY